MQNYLKRPSFLREDRDKVRLQAEELQKRKAEIDAEIAASSTEQSSAGQRETTPCGDDVSAAAPPTPDMKTKLQKYREEKAQAVVEQQRLRQVEERQCRLQQIETEIAQMRARLEAANKSVMVQLLVCYILNADYCLGFGNREESRETRAGARHGSLAQALLGLSQRRQSRSLC